MRILLAAIAALFLAAPAAAASFDFSFKILREFNGRIDPGESLAGTGRFETADGVAAGGTTGYAITGASGTIMPSFASDPAVYTITGVGPFFGTEDNRVLVAADGTVGFSSIGLYFEGGPGGLSFASATGAAYAFEGSYVIDRFAIAPAAASDAPEPATWAAMILGFGMVGAAARRRPAALA